MRRKMYHGLFASFLVVVISSLACVKSLPQLSGQSPSGRIVYQSNQDGNFEIYLVDVSKKTPVRLTNNTANDVYPTYIPATEQIGFVSDRQNGWNLYVMDVYGENVIKVTNNKKWMVEFPDWSADGKYITTSLVEKCAPPATACYYDIYVMNADGTQLNNLTNTPGPKSEWVPVWSPDGQKIAFASDRDGDSEVYVMDKDGTNLVQLTENKGYDGTPRWSPDGTKLSFDTDWDGVDWDIYIMDADGSSPKPVTNNSTSDFSASWSPDGKWLVYLSNADGDNEIFIVDIDGQNQQRLTNDSFIELSPIWIP